MPSSGIALFMLLGASDFYAPHHHFSFLISHSSEAFHPQSKGFTPTG